MKKRTGECPYCGSQMKVERMKCPKCDMAVEGDFAHVPLGHLSPEQQKFIEMFVLTSGSLKEMARILDISYPTVRNRLDRVIDAVKQAIQEESGARNALIDAVAEGRLSAGEAAEILRNL